MKIVHLRDKCIGCNACVEVASSFWKISNKDGKVNLLNAVKKRDNIFVLDINEFDFEINNKASESCPVNCIKIEK